MRKGGESEMAEKKIEVTIKRVIPLGKRTPASGAWQEVKVEVPEVDLGKLKEICSESTVR